MVHTVDAKVIVVWSESPKSLSSEGRDASKQFLVNLKNIPAEGVVLLCENTRIKTSLEKLWKTSLRRCHQSWKPKDK